jgi:phosphoglycerate dehydrogenase-like enzyme
VDVFPQEPALLAPFVHPQVIVTPHAAGWHPELGASISAGVAAAVRALLAGEPIPWRL